MTLTTRILAGVVGLLFVYWMAPSRPAPVKAPAPDEVVQLAMAVEHSTPVPQPAETVTRIKELTAQRDYIARKARAAQHRPAELKVVQSRYAARWLAVLTTNQATYLALREQAKSEGGKTFCTICNGDGRATFCVVCDDHPTKCPDCKGSGRGFGVELCYTCEGSGLCALCGGTARMLCAFCDDGMILTRRPPPSYAIPLR